MSVPSRQQQDIDHGVDCPTCGAVAGNLCNNLDSAYACDERVALARANTYGPCASCGHDVHRTDGLCADCLRVFVDRAHVEDIVTSALQSKTIGLELLPTDPDSALEALADSGRTDDDALTAYDLIHNLRVFGRAY